MMHTPAHKQTNQAPAQIYLGRRSAAAEAIADADAHLNNVALPTYSMTLQTLRYLTSQAEMSDLNPGNGAFRKARELLKGVDAVAAA